MTSLPKASFHLSLEATLKYINLHSSWKLFLNYITHQSHIDNHHSQSLP
jgi:hypothetical protein